MEKNANTSNISLPNIKSIKGLRNLIKASMNKEKSININNQFPEENKSNIINNIFDDKYNFYINNNKNGANINGSYNEYNNMSKIKNKIKEIVIKTNYSRNPVDYNNTTPLPVNKQNKKFNVLPVKLNIKKLILTNRNRDSINNIPYSYEDRLNNFFENKKKSFSHSFRNISNIMNEEKSNNNTLTIENNTINTTTHINNRIKRKMSQNYDMKINTNNINNIYENKKTPKIFIKKNIKLSHNNSNYYNNINNIKNQMTNVTFDTDFLNFTDVNFQNNDNKNISKDIENKIKIKLKENNEIKQNILLMMDDIKKIKEKQDIIINEKEKNLKNNERIIKISNIIKKTYNFLNDFNRVINEQNQQIYQEIIQNLNMFFSD